MPKPFLAITFVLAISAGVRAGVYNTAEEPPLLSTDFFKFRNETLIPLRQLGSPETHTPLNNRYLMMAKLPRANLSIDDRINVGAYLIRLRKYREAVDVLTPAYHQQRDNFLVLANLATAEQLDNQLRRAEAWLGEALDKKVWREKFHDLPEAKRQQLEKIGWNEGPYGWYREVETYHHKLLKLRNREPPSTALPEAPDELFGQVLWVGPSGKFEPGKLDLMQKKLLPKNAILIVEQLLAWLPDDMRLYWLLGELFNAEGNAADAKEILEEVDRKWNPKASKDFTGFQTRNRGNPKLFQEHLDALKSVQREAPDLNLDEKPKPKPAVDDERPFDWPLFLRAFGVGLLAGLLIALFGYWQIREIRRRRQARSGV